MTVEDQGPFSGLGTPLCFATNPTGTDRWASLSPSLVKSLSFLSSWMLPQANSQPFAFYAFYYESWWKQMEMEGEAPGKIHHGRILQRSQNFSEPWPPVPDFFAKSP